MKDITRVAMYAEKWWDDAGRSHIGHQPFPSESEAAAAPHKVAVDTKKFYSLSWSCE